MQDDERTTMKAGPLKLTATIRPTSAVPFTTSSLLSALLKAPPALLLSMPRIIYQAWILHYRKGLDVYARPEPYFVASSTTGDEAEARISAVVEGGIGWQPEGPLEAYARRRTEAFLRQRVQQIDTAISLVSANPAVPTKTFGSPKEAASHLVIQYMSPRFFSTLFLVPSGSHALLTASDQAHGKIDRIFRVSDRALFLEVFEGQGSGPWTTTQRLRVRPVPDLILAFPGLPIPPRHPLELQKRSLSRTCADFSVLALLVLAEWLEKWIFGLVKARFVPGDEPWGRWARAETSLRNDLTSGLPKSDVT
jgi:hypothetical protein